MATGDDAVNPQGEPSGIRLVTDVGSLFELRHDYEQRGYTVRWIRGRKARTTRSLFDEFAAAFQFPEHFGDNWDAFNDCLTDLEWLRTDRGYVLVITEPDAMLAAERAKTLKTFVEILTDAVQYFVEDPAHSWQGDMRPLEFHVLLIAGKANPSVILRRWQRAGVVVADG